MKLFQSLLVAGLADAWTQPSYPEFLKLLRERSNVAWGRPINTERRLQSRMWSECPELELPENAKELKCQRSTCSMICNLGFLATGKKRVACRKRNGNFMWIKSLGSCKTCDPIEPTPNDSDVNSKCTVNKLGRRICTYQCPSGRPFEGFNLQKIKATCKCPRGKCGWKKGVKSIDVSSLTCKGGSATTTAKPTTKTTKPPPVTQTTTKATTKSEASADLSAFENGPARLTATQSCSVGQMTRFVGESKIIDGVTAGKGSWPWIVSMSFFAFEFGGAALCGGSIINDNWIITAAHCCRDSVKAKAIVGEFNRHADDVGQFEVISRTMFKHPLYKSGNGMDWDACLVKVPSLSKAAPETCKNCFTAACIPDVPPVHGRHCWVAGWGHTKEGSSIASKLQEVGVNLFSWQYCIDKSKYTRVVNAKSELCAGIPDRDNDGFIDGGKDACQGDSGGPLVCDDDGVATMYGLVSWGEGCARKGSPGIYASVFDIRDWIEDTIAKN